MDFSISGHETRSLLIRQLFVKCLNNAAWHKSIEQLVLSSPFRVLIKLRGRGLLFISSVDILAVFVLIFFCHKFCLFLVDLFRQFLPIDFLFLFSVSLSSHPLLMNCATFPQIFPPPVFSLILFSFYLFSPFSSLSFQNHSICSVMSDAKIIGDLMHFWYSAHIL